jgi:hypothetical protein
MYSVADWVKMTIILKEFTVEENKAFQMPMGLRVAYTVIKVLSNLFPAEMPNIVDNLIHRRYRNLL